MLTADKHADSLFLLLICSCATGIRGFAGDILLLEKVIRAKLAAAKGEKPAPDEEKADKVTKAKAKGK